MTYKELGWADRESYMNDLAVYYFVDRDTVEYAATMMGYEDDFDKLVAFLEDTYSEDVNGFNQH